MKHTDEIMDLDLEALRRGEYERDNLPPGFSSDAPQPDFGYHVLNASNLLYKPLIDRERLHKKLKPPVWPDNKPFAVCLTHDVDLVSLNNPRQYLRRAASLFRQWRYRKDKIYRRELRISLQDFILALTRWSKPDPYCCFEQWLECEEAAGGHSTFFFFPDTVRKPHWSDCYYRFTDPVSFQKRRITVAELIRTIDQRGWEVGLHASWYAFNDASELSYQKSQIEQVLGRDISSVRQHFLHYDIRTTPRVHTQAGFRYDSTLGFNNNIGFRFGTSYPFPLFDLEESRMLPVMEIPLVIQEGALMNNSKGLRLDEDTAFKYIAKLTDEVADVAGVLTLLWHTNTYSTPEIWNLYQRTLSHLKSHGAWLASVQEIGEWWNSTNGHIKV